MVLASKSSARAAPHKESLPGMANHVAKRSKSNSRWYLLRRCPGVRCVMGADFYSEDFKTAKLRITRPYRRSALRAGPVGCNPRFRPRSCPGPRPQPGITGQHPRVRETDVAGVLAGS